MVLIIGRGKLSDVEHKVTVSAFCRRRLPVVMQRLRMADHVQAAIKFIEQGHVRVGTDVITDPAYLVTRYGMTKSVQVASSTDRLLGIWKILSPGLTLQRSRETS